MSSTLSSSLGLLRVEARDARSSGADGGVVPGDEVGTTPGKAIPVAYFDYPPGGDW